MTILERKARSQNVNVGDEREIVERSDPRSDF
jgi:hypothetical protein